MSRPGPAARWRGAAAALFTVSLALGAHVLADGGAPSGAAIAMLLLLAGTLGAIEVRSQRSRPGAGLIVTLALGQVLGHLVLAATGHSHGNDASPAMLGAHAAVVVVGAVLIAAGDRLCRALSNVVRSVSASTTSPARPAAVDITTSDQPLQWMHLLASSVSHRGPPVSRGA